MGVALVRIRPDDNVAVATRAVAAGERVATAQGAEVVAREEIPYGNKIALERIERGAAVVKYGERIGDASRDIEPGEVVHTHNVTPLDMPAVYIETT